MSGTPERPTVIPRIFVDDPAGLVDFLGAVFDAGGVYRSGRPAEITVGTSLLMVSGTEERPAATVACYVYVPDVDAAYRRAIETGATSIEPPADMPYGERRAMVADPWRNSWQLAAPLPA